MIVPPPTPMAGNSTCPLGMAASALENWVGSGPEKMRITTKNGKIYEQISRLIFTPNSTAPSLEPTSTTIFPVRSGSACRYRNFSSVMEKE